MAKKHRLQFDLEDDAYEKFEEIRERAGCQTRAEVFRQALRVLDWVLRQRESGKTIQVVGNDDIKEVEILF